MSYIRRDKQLRQLLRAIPSEELTLLQAKSYRKGSYVIREAVFAIFCGIRGVILPIPRRSLAIWI